MAQIQRGICYCLIAGTLLIPSTGSAHPGRTDKNGGHWDRKAGTYHYHNGGSGDSNPGDEIVQGVTAIELTLSSEHPYVFVGDEAQMLATVLPDDALNPAIIWTSSKSTIASINDKGLITAKLAGITTIRATAKDGTKTVAAMDLYVLDPLTEEDFPLTKESPKSHITTLQTRLIQLGMLEGEADGILGEETSAKLAQFAATNELEYDGACSYDLFTIMLEDIG